MANNENEAKLMEWNARTLITVWGNKDVSEELHDYSSREWSGMLKDFYKPRWQLFIDSLKNDLNNIPCKSIDYYK
jgi:alpha-N-acetylglucosaminidase